LTYDVHAHIVPVELMDLLRKDGPRFGLEVFQTTEGKEKIRIAGRLEIGPFPGSLFDLDARFEAMDRGGVGIQVVGHRTEFSAYALDGDNLRHSLSADLGFAPPDRREHIRRVAEVAKLFTETGALVITALISPYRDDRQRARALVDAGRFVEVYVNASIAECERRDPKGLYKRARAGEIAEFTGVSAPYEAPQHAEIVVDTEGCSVRECVAQIIDDLQSRGLLGGSHDKRL